MKTIRLNDDQRRWLRDYLHTNKDCTPDDPYTQLLRALLERPEVTDIQVRADHRIVQVMIREIGW